MEILTSECIFNAQAWFGLAELGSGAFSHAEIMGPFCHILWQHNKFDWTKYLDDAYEASKQKIAWQVSLGVKNVDPQHVTCLAIDYSGVGLVFFFLQKHFECPGTTPTHCKSG